MSLKSWALLGFLAACGCTQGPNVRAELPLKRVVVYRNGVGYFERAGQVDEDAVRFEMRQRMVGDFLASLAVIEKNGNSVRSASFPLQAPDEEVAPEPEPQPGDPSTPPKKPRKADPNAMREVVLHLDGKEHDLLIGYLSESPVWRPSYRIVVEADGSAALQAWGIVENLSGEDWNEVSLSLVAGAPIAFQSNLGTPVIPQRPIVTDNGEVMAVVPQAVTSLDEDTAPEPPQAPAAEESKAEGYGYSFNDKAMQESAAPAPANAPMPAKRATRNAAGDRGGVASGFGGGIEAAPPHPPIVRELAGVAIEGSTTRYDMPFKVTVPDQSATMVLLTSQRVPGETVWLFAPEGGVAETQSHPFRVARITNSTPGLLERGPIAVFERGSFLGQGLLDPLPPRATATVPFALERGISVAVSTSDDHSDVRLHRIQGGQLWVDQDFVQLTKYEVQNGNDKGGKLLLKHVRRSDTRLVNPPKGTEDNVGTGSALVPLDLKPHAKAGLTIDERSPDRMYLDWFDPRADIAVRGYISDARADQALAQALSAAWKVRALVVSATDELNVLENERVDLERQSEQTRGNLKAIEKNPQAQDLRTKLTKRLAEMASRLDAITKRSIEVRMVLDEQSVRFREAIRELNFDKPLAPLPGK